MASVEPVEQGKLIHTACCAVIKSPLYLTQESPVFCHNLWNCSRQLVSLYVVQNLAPFIVLNTSKASDFYFSSLCCSLPQSSLIISFFPPYSYHRIILSLIILYLLDLTSFSVYRQSFQYRTWHTIHICWVNQCIWKFLFKEHFSLCLSWAM